MRKAIGWGVQLQKRMVRRIKLERLLRSGVGTGKVEKLATKLALEMRGGRRGEVEERERRSMVRRKVLMLMTDKVKDAYVDADLAFTQYCKAKKDMWKVVPWDSRVGSELREVMRREMGFEWHERMRIMQRSVNHLVDKHRMLRKEVVPAMWRGIKITDQALGEQQNLPPPFLGEGVGQITEAAKEILQLPPKTALYTKIKMADIQMEVAKAVDAKARWTDIEMEKRREGGQTREEADEEERRMTEVHNKQEGILKLANMRVTDLPTSREIYLPEERSNEVEAGLQAFSAEMIEVARNYIKQNVDKEGNVKESNMTEKQVVGLKDVERIIQDKNFIVTSQEDNAS